MLVLFDFDGTLADTFPRAVRLLPRLSRELRFRDPGAQELAALREQGLRQILSVLGISWWKVPLLLWRARMLLRRDLEPIPFFSGVAELLNRLDAAGTEWGILTTNGIELVRRTLRENGAPEPGWLEAGLGLSGKADQLRSLSRRAGVALAEIVLVADECRDVEAARSAGVAMVAVAWGYNTAQALARAGAVRTARDVGELGEMLGVEKA
jgi:phosphoglycolate phosphatase